MKLAFYFSFRMIFMVALCQPLLIPTLPAVLMQTVFFCALGSGSQFPDVFKNDARAAQ